MSRKTPPSCRPVGGAARARRRGATPDRRAGRPTPTGSPAPLDTCIIGILLGGHLGDTLITTPLARQLVQEKGLTVKVTEHPSTRAAFANNPFVHDYTTSRGMALVPWLKGGGHVLQQLQRGLGVEVSDPPRPEVYLSREERAWASTWLAEHVPARRKVCVLSPRAVTTAGRYEGADWDQVSLALQEEYAVVQPVLSAEGVHEGQPRQPRPGRRRHEGQTPGAIIAVDLPTRHYLALVAAADLFVGVLSGGAHASAAFHVPAIVVVWPELAPRIKFPVDGLGIGEEFAYPTQAHLCTSSVTRSGFDGRALRDKISEALALEPVRPPRGVPPRDPGRRRSAG
ncbi:MAG: hypothetical protein HY906_07895 [Deltaproteobacteria bacterium]|nr:hypothetical protein [Deltaproteobacteria bacterium]